MVTGYLDRIFIRMYFYEYLSMVSAILKYSFYPIHGPLARSTDLFQPLNVIGMDSNATDPAAGSQLNKPGKKPMVSSMLMTDG